MTLRDRLRSRSQPVRASLRVRLLVGTLAGIAVAIAVAGWALGGLFQQHVAQQFTAQLTTHLDQLTAGLGRRVTISPGKKKGKIALEYYDQEDLEGLMQALSALDTGKERRKP